MPKSLPNGFLIVFEGIDGVGKTTQLQLAADELSSGGWPILIRRNLGGTPIGEELRKVILGPTPRPSQTNLYISAAIQAALLEEVNKDRKSDKLILMDRGPLSLAAYEVYGSRLDQKIGMPHVEEGMGGLKPDLTIIYKAEVATALKRAKQQSVQPDLFESQPLAYFERVAKGYDELASLYSNVIVIEADRPIENVHDATMSAIYETLSKSS